MKKYRFDAEPFSRAFLENKKKTMEERMALAMYEAAGFLPIDFPENCMLPTVGIDENGELYCPACTDTPQFAPGVLPHPENGSRICLPFPH